MKTLRVVLLLLGVWLIAAAACGILSYLVPWLFGISQTTLADWLSLLTWILALVCGIGLLRLKDWARRGLIGLVALKALLLGYGFFIVRNMGLDSFGLFLVGVIFLFFGIVLFGLHRAAVVTNAHEKPKLAGWTIAGIVAGVISVGGYGLLLTDIDPLKLGDLDTRSNGELNFLKVSTEWELTSFRIVNSRGGNATVRETGTSQMTSRYDNGNLILQGIPSLSGIGVEIDLGKNALSLDGVVFPGKPVKTDRLLWQDIPAEGVKFENEMGRFSGTITLARELQENKVYLLVELDVYGKTVSAYYSAKPGTLNADLP